MNTESNKKEKNNPQCVSIDVELVTQIENKAIKCTNLQQTCSSFENGRCKMVSANCVFQVFI